MSRGYVGAKDFVNRVEPLTNLLRSDAAPDEPQRPSEDRDHSVVTSRVPRSHRISSPTRSYEARLDAARSRSRIRAGWRPIITKIFTWSAFCCRSACIRISTTSTRSAAGPTIWATRSAIPQESLRLLAWWRSELQAMYAGEPTHPVFVALSGHGRAALTCPSEPFDDLIKAFEQDQTVTRYRRFRGAVRVLPLFGESGRTAGAWVVRVSRR